MTNCDKAQAFFKALNSLELYTVAERRYWEANSDVTMDDHSYAVKRMSEAKNELYNLVMGE